MTHPIENIMRSSMEHIKQLADVNTVIGTPIMTDDNTMILPVSKVSLGMLVGGGEYSAQGGSRKSSYDSDTNANYPFVGASTLGMSLTPLAFLAVQEDAVRVLPAKQDCSLDRLIDMVPQIIDAAERLIAENNKSCQKKGKERAVHISRIRTEKDKPYSINCEHIPFANDDIKDYSSGDEVNE